MNAERMISGVLWLPAAVILGLVMLAILARNDRKPSPPIRPESDIERDRRMLGAWGVLRYPLMTPDGLTMTIQSKDGKRFEATRRTEKECIAELHAKLVSL